MYLLHCRWDGSLESLSITLEACTGALPKYAILSHRWASNPEDEVTFEDMTYRSLFIKNKKGYRKIAGCCARALRDGLSWVWVDTCCIDKRSSAELSEAINSMYNWYEKSERCYAYLEDVHTVDGPKPLRQSSWFKRGWTLQELIAPADIEFFSQSWDLLGNKLGLADVLAEITKISTAALVDGIHVYNASVAEKMSWAVNRETTREEDRAYSLMGIFGVNMPPLYGEGYRAFTRLQQEIMRASNDQSLFAWQRKSLAAGLLADSPDDFAHSSTYRPVDYQAFTKTFGLTTAKPDFTMTNFGLKIQLPLIPMPDFDGYFIAFLACKISITKEQEDEDEISSDEWVSIFLCRSPDGFHRQFIRTSFQNHMIGVGRIPCHTYDTEPIWISPNEDISPLLWKPAVQDRCHYLRFPITNYETEDTMTIIMERHHRHIVILSAYPVAMFSTGNEILLKSQSPLRSSVGVMIVQNQRGRDCRMFIIFAFASWLCIGYSTVDETAQADEMHERFLNSSLTCNVGFTIIPSNTTHRSSLMTRGYFLSLECLGAMTYRFTLRTSQQGANINHEGRGLLAGGLQMNDTVTLSLREFTYRGSSMKWDQVCASIRASSKPYT